MTIIHTVNGPCGSYKTSKAIEWASQVSRKLGSAQILYAAPSMRLLDEVCTKAQKSGLIVKRIDSSTSPDGVFKDLLAAMQEPHPDGIFVACTHKALFDMEYWGEFKHNWQLVIDEIPQVDSEYLWKLAEPEHFKLIMGRLDAFEDGDNAYLRLRPRPEAKTYLERIAKNKDADSMAEWMQEYRDLAQNLCNKEVEVWVSRASWNAVSYNKTGHLYMHAIRLPTALEGWGSVQMMGANFDKSLLKMIWEQCGVEFKTSHLIKPAASAHAEELGRRITIHAFSEKNWSKKLFASLGEHDHVDEAAVAALTPMIKEVMGDDEFVYSLNNYVPDSAMEKHFNAATRIPNNPFGMNSFQHIDHAVWLTCLNNKSPHYAFLSARFGIPSDLVAKARNHEFAYQSVMRTSARNPSAKAACKFIVPDMATANSLVENFPGCTLVGLELAQFVNRLGSAKKARGRPRKEVVMTGAEKQARRRAKQREMRSTENSIRTTLFRHTDSVEFSEQLEVGSIHVFRSKDASGLTRWEELREHFRRFVTEFLPKKEDATLISGALFDEGGKGLAHVLAINGVWFDIDQGEMMPSEWQMIFPEFKLMMFNTFKNGIDGQTRYRVLFPTTRPQTPQEYVYTWDRMIDRIRQAGWFIGSKDAWEKLKMHGTRLSNSGIDVSKRTPNSFFYLPSRAKMGKAYSFFIEQWGEEHVFLDPDQFQAYDEPVRTEAVLVRPYRNPGEVNKLDEIRDALLAQPEDHDDDHQKTAVIVAKAEARWEATCKGSRFREFLIFASALQRAGLDRFEIIEKLQTVQPVHPYGRELSQRIREVCRSLGI